VDCVCQKRALPTLTPRAKRDRFCNLSLVSGGQRTRWKVVRHSTVTSVETAISFANSNNLATQGNVAFIAGATDGYLLVDQNDGGLFGFPTSSVPRVFHLDERQRILKHSILDNFKVRPSCLRSSRCLGCHCALRTRLRL